MTTRMYILTGMIAGFLWGAGVIWIGSTQLEIPIFTRPLIVPFFTLAPGLVLAAMIATVGLRRASDPTISDGSAPTPGSRADIDRRVLQNTIEQAVLALCLWTPISFLLPETGLGVVICLSVSFAIARILFWVGYHISPPLRAFGFAATFYPTIMAMIWAGIWWAML